MKYYLVQVFCFIALSTIFVTIGNATNFWKEYDQKFYFYHADSSILPEKYATFLLDSQGIRSYLNENYLGSKILIPDPDGKSIEFLIFETPIIPENLSNRYPEIKTYTGISTENSFVTAKIDFTSKGFHAMVFNGEHTYLIDPYYIDNEIIFYAVYFKSDYKVNTRNSCILEDHIQDPVPDANGVVPEELSFRRATVIHNGNQRKTYRLALSCTGEYAVAVDGPSPTKLGVLSAMVTTLNRVNGIYERELSVNMQLVDNTDTLIFLHAATDPFSNTNTNAMMAQNQAVVNDRIGNENYDIGHVFSTGNGGMASSNSVCRDGFKARGVTGTSQPMGDAYDVDFVSHEIGHQFGASHTFNRCSGSNGVSGYAYEPGSGSTIMGYAGICGFNNLQRNSDAYFHFASLDQITEYISGNSIDGVGGTCGTSSMGIHPPDIQEIGKIYNIPFKTSFELGVHDTINTNNEIMYSWEQCDLGNFNINEVSGGNFLEGPSFRSFFSSESNIRVFPRIDSLLKYNYSYVGERLPEQERKLHFRLTARKYEQGWGAFRISADSVTVHAFNTGEPFKVTYPNDQSINWHLSSIDSVVWNVSSSNLFPINCFNVDILLSLDGGYTYPYTLLSNIPNIGIARFSLPGSLPSTSKARVKVKCSDNIFFDISDYNFSIGDPSNINDQSLITGIEVYPNPSNAYINIKNRQYIKNYDVALYNYIGQLVWKGILDTELKIPVGNYAKGVYFLHIYSSLTKDRKIEKVIIK